MKGLQFSASIMSMIPLIAMASPAWSDVKIEDTKNSYEIRGLTTEAIHNDIMKNAPREGDDIIDGETLDKITWSLNYSTEDKECHVTSDSVRLQLKMTLPTWIDESRASPKVRAAWDAYLLALRGHEYEHKAIAVKAAHAVDRLIHSDRSGGSCNVLNARLNDAAEKIVAEGEREQDRLDSNARSFDIE